METNTRKSNLPAIAFALAALTATLPTPAIAGGEPASETVPYGDLNLATQAGIDALDRRLDRAVERVCGSASVRELHAQRRVTRCREATRQSIEDDRQFAIAQATGQQEGRREWAENAQRDRTQVTRAE